jgi:fructose-bisphosphate aldolase, class II
MKGIAMTVVASRRSLDIEGVRDLMRTTRAEQFAVGAFNAGDLETLKAISEAAAAMNSPVLIEASASEVSFVGLSLLRAIVDACVDEFGIEAYLNLDHSPSVESAKAGIDAGFEMIHIDLSGADHALSSDEVVRGTRAVVEYAKTTGALVESENHWFSGSSTLHREGIATHRSVATTDPEEAKRFVDATGIDTFAVAIGNLHGAYPSPPELDFGLLKTLREELSVNLSLHGGSGITQTQLEGAVAEGISKVNINSDLRIAHRVALEAQLHDNPDEYATVKLMDPVVDAVRTVVEQKITAFGSSKRATLR